MEVKSLKFTIIGGGNIGGSIANGILNAQIIPAENLTITRRRIKLLQNFAEKGVNISTDNPKAVSEADIIFLAIEPRYAEMILREITPYVKSNDTIIASVVAGFLSSEIREIMARPNPIIRFMPNTAIAFCESMTCISFHSVNEEQENVMLEIFNHLGVAIKIEEDLMKAATVLCSTGIAFALRYIRAASQGGVEIGFDADTAQLIAAQTVKGAASLLQKREQHPEKEIDMVTTPQGITISGLNEMEHKGFSSSLIKGILTSFNKFKSLNYEVS